MRMRCRGKSYFENDRHIACIAAIVVGLGAAGCNAGIKLPFMGKKAPNPERAKEPGAPNHSAASTDHPSSQPGESHPPDSEQERSLPTNMPHVTVRRTSVDETYSLALPIPVKSGWQTDLTISRKTDCKDAPDDLHQIHRILRSLKVVSRSVHISKQSQQQLMTSIPPYTQFLVGKADQYRGCPDVVKTTNLPPLFEKIGRTKEQLTPKSLKIAFEQADKMFRARTLSHATARSNVETAIALMESKRHAACKGNTGATNRAIYYGGKVPVPKGNRERLARVYLFCNGVVVHRNLRSKGWSNVQVINPNDPDPNFARFMAEIDYKIEKLEKEIRQRQYSGRVVPRSLLRKHKHLKHEWKKREQVFIERKYPYKEHVALARAYANKHKD